MSEPGRSVIGGTRAVMNTNAVFKTGGGFHLGGFHSENYYSPDVPALQSFWCKEPPIFGGETALVQSAAVYDEFSADLRARLEAERAFVGSVPIAEVAKRYDRSVAEVEVFCERVGLEIGEGDDGKELRLYKPVVFRHPHTGRPALQVNVSGEIPGIDDALRRIIAPSYHGPRWMLHRLGWRHPALASCLGLLDSWRVFGQLPAAGLAAARAAGAFVVRSVRPKPVSAPAPAVTPRGPRLRERLTPDDVETIAQAIWRHTALIAWKRGDVVVFDNLQVLHAGMPGAGKRELRVMMCDPIPMFPVRGGVLEVLLTPRRNSLDAQLRASCDDPPPA